MKIFSLFLSLFIMTHVLYAADVDEWHMTTADITIIKDDAKALKPEGTVLGKLLELNKRSLWSMMEEDGTVLTLEITYQPVNQPLAIHLIGFYRTFSVTLQRLLEAQGVLNKPIQIKIVYRKNLPMEIRVFNDGTLLNVPPLLPKSN